MRISGDEKTDKELILLARSGEQEAFSQLVERYQSLVKSIAVRMVQNEEIARELAQEAILQAFLSMDRLRNIERFKSWLYGIVINVCRSYLRDQKVDVLSLENLPGGWDMDARSPDPQEISEERERHHLILSAIQGLSPINREAVYLYYYRHLSLQEIAKATGISVEAVKVRLHRARGQLRTRLLNLFPEIEPVYSPEQRRKTMVRVTIADIIKIDEASIVLLLDEAGQRVLPIWIGPYEALSIAMGLREVTTPRPMTYTFMISMMDALSAELEEVRVEALKEDTFYGVAKLRSNDQVKELDARPSDVLALAARTGSPMYAGDEVMERAGIDISQKKVSPALKAGKGIDDLLRGFEQEIRKPSTRSPEEREKGCNRVAEYIFSAAE